MGDLNKVNLIDFSHGFRLWELYYEQKLLDNKVTLGADASVAAGPVGRRGGVGTDAAMSAEIVSYSRSRGLFAGIDLSGGVLRPDHVPTVEGDNNERPGYSSFGRLYAIGYIRGLRDAVYATPN